MAPHILVTLDGSAFAERVLPHATSLARTIEGDIVLVRVVVLPTRSGLSDKAYGDLTIAQAQDYLNGVAQRLSHNSLRVQTEVLHGHDVATVIVERARQDPQVHAIAMSTHGRSGVQRWMMGSVADTVLTASTVPLLLVHINGDTTLPVPERRYRTIVVPIDGTTNAAYALSEARVIAEHSGATVIAMTAVPALDAVALAEGGAEPYWMLADADSEVSRLSNALLKTAAYLETEGVTVRTKHVPGAPAEAIIRVCREEHADLLIMATRGHRGLKRLLFGSTAAKIVPRADFPVLLTPTAYP